MYPCTVSVVGKTNLLLLVGTVCRCDWCGISESVQGLHREPNLNAAVKFRMMTNKTILVKLWNNSATRKVVPPFCIISWWSQGGPGNQEHATDTEWPYFPFTLFDAASVRLESRINLQGFVELIFSLSFCWVWPPGLFWHENVAPRRTLLSIAFCIFFYAQGELVGIIEVDNQGINCLGCQRCYAKSN